MPWVVEVQPFVFYFCGTYGISRLSHERHTDTYTPVLSRSSGLTSSCSRLGRWAQVDGTERQRSGVNYCCMHDRCGSFGFNGYILQFVRTCMPTHIMANSCMLVWCVCPQTPQTPSSLEDFLTPPKKVMCIGESATYPINNSLDGPDIPRAKILQNAIINSDDFSGKHPCGAKVHKMTQSTVTLVSPAVQFRMNEHTLGARPMSCSVFAPWPGRYACHQSPHPLQQPALLHVSFS